MLHPPIADRNVGAVAQKKAQFWTRVQLLLDHEPSWAPEMASALGIMVWSASALLTPLFSVHGVALLLPVGGLLFGAIRPVLLLRLFYTPRMTAALLGAIFWLLIMSSALQRFSILPSMGPITAVLFADVFTMARFSLPCYRELLVRFVQPPH